MRLHSQTDAPSERMLDMSSRGRIDEFEQALADFKKKIELGAVIHTAVVSLRTSEGINTLCAFMCFCIRAMLTI